MILHNTKENKYRCLEEDGKKETMSTPVESAVLALAGRESSRQLKSKSKWTDGIAIVALFLFGVVGTVTMGIGAAMGAINNLEAQSTAFKILYAGGYILLCIGGLLALASHWHWFGYRDALARETNTINATPAIMGVFSIIAILGGIVMIHWAVWAELDTNK
jgi:hypothetical protein